MGRLNLVSVSVDGASLTKHFHADETATRIEITNTPSVSMLICSNLSKLA